jgi:hypothetical protein
MQFKEDTVIQHNKIQPLAQHLLKTICRNFSFEIITTSAEYLEGKHEDYLVEGIPSFQLFE